MAYIVVYQRDQEIERRELGESLTVGRSLDCDLTIHDILLSRRHCKIHAEGESWIISDLGSKNGTRVGGKPTFHSKIADGDVIRLGKTAIRFRAGAFVDPSRRKLSAQNRPADPFEALAGTVRDFTFEQSTISPNGIPLPSPTPAPKEPAAYSSDNVREMVSQLVSNSWDSIHEKARRSNTVMSHLPKAQANRPKPSRDPRAVMAHRAHPARASAPLPRATIAPAKQTIIPAQKACAPAKLHARAARPRTLRLLLRSLAPIVQWLAMVMLICPKP